MPVLIVHARPKVAMALETYSCTASLTGTVNTCDAHSTRSGAVGLCAPRGAPSTVHGEGGIAVGQRRGVERASEPMAHGSAVAHRPRQGRPPAHAAWMYPHEGPPMLRHGEVVWSLQVYAYLLRRRGRGGGACRDSSSSSSSGGGVPLIREGGDDPATAAGRHPPSLSNELLRVVAGYLYPPTHPDPWECLWQAVAAEGGVLSDHWELSLSVASRQQARAAAYAAETGTWLSYYLDDNASIDASERVIRRGAEGPAAWEAMHLLLTAPPLGFDDPVLLSCVDRIVYHHHTAIAGIYVAYDRHGALFGMDVVFHAGSSVNVRAQLDYVLVVHGQRTDVDGEDGVYE